MARLITIWDWVELFFFATFTSVKYKLQVLLFFMEQDLMEFFCEAFFPVIFALVLVQMKYFPVKHLLSCLSYFPSKMNQLSYVPFWFKGALISVLTACLEDVWCRRTYVFSCSSYFWNNEMQSVQGFYKFLWRINMSMLKEFCHHACSVVIHCHHTSRGVFCGDSWKFKW